MSNTKEQFEVEKKKCREIFIKKLKDYSTSWRIMRPSSLTDQIYIKARRIRSIEEKGEKNIRIKEGIEPEFIGIINYCAIALIQIENGSENNITEEEAIKQYDRNINKALSLMLDKNHDYDEAWRKMRISSFTDIILQKLLRTKEIEDHNGLTLISEGIDANYLDIINYAFFALIKLQYGD